MKRWTILWLSLAALPAHAHETNRQVRDDWYIGFSLGSGPASLTIDDKRWSYTEFFEKLGPFDESVFNLGLNFQVGWTATPQLLVGAEIAAMARLSEGDVDVHLQHNQYLVAVTWFPLPDGKGLLLKGGAGLSVIALEISSTNLRASGSERGFGGMAGIGYAFWLGDAFNLTLNNDFHFATFGGDRGEPTGGFFDLISLGFMWY